MNDMKGVCLNIDGKTVQAAAGATILDAARAAGVEIPTLCYLEGVEAFGGCRLCTVKVTVNGVAAMKTACSERCAQGMVVQTDSAEVREYRRYVLDTLLSDHLNSCFSCPNHDGCRTRKSALCAYDENCFTCGARESCKLREYALAYGLTRSSYETKVWPVPADDSRALLRYDPNRCIRCRRCQRSCEKQQGESLILVLGRGRDTVISLPDDARCADCLKCAESCPTGALQVK